MSLRHDVSATGMVSYNEINKAKCSSSAFCISMIDFFSVFLHEPLHHTSLDSYCKVYNVLLKKSVHCYSWYIIGLVTHYTHIYIIDNIQLGD